MSTLTDDSLDFGNGMFALAPTLTYSSYPVFIFTFLFALSLPSSTDTQIISKIIFTCVAALRRATYTADVAPGIGSVNPALKHLRTLLPCYK